MKINRKKHRKFYTTVIAVIVGIGLIVDTYFTMETYWTNQCNNTHCTVCNKDN